MATFWGFLARKHQLLELPRRLLALCRWTRGGERHRYAIAWPDKIGTDPMAVDGYSLTPSQETGRTQDESGAYLRAPSTHWSRFPRRRSFMFTVNRHRVGPDSIESCNCVSMAFTVESPPARPR